MRSLTEYLQNLDSKEGVVLFESLENIESVQQVYEAIGYKMLEDSDDAVNEAFGWLKNLANWGEKADKKIDAMKDAAKEKIANMSDAAKKAIENVKAQAGEKWEQMKDVYTSTVALIDDAISKSKTAMEALAKQAGAKIENIEAAMAGIYANAMAKGTELGNKLTEWAADKTKGAAKIAALNAFYMGAALSAKVGIDSNALIDLMSLAGVK